MPCLGQQTRRLNLQKISTATNYNKIKYGRKSITPTSLNIWNQFAKHVFPNVDLTALSREKAERYRDRLFSENVYRH